jgi:hypothetical protein
MRRSQRTWIDEVLEKLFVFALIAAAIYILNIFFPAIGIFLTSPIGTPFGG